MPNEWISVKYRLPDKDGEYLCCDKDKYIYILSFAKNLLYVDKYDFGRKKRSGFYDYDIEWGYCEWDEVTHWMPMPEPPKEGADNG